MSDITPETPVAATPPNPENIAEFLAYCANDASDDGGNMWFPVVKAADGGVVEIDINPADDNGTATYAIRRFRAVVAEVPAYAVADEPVKLPADLARELAYGEPGDSCEGWTVVANDYVEKQRWESLHWLVIRNEQGEHFADTYRRGLTEHQDSGAYENETQVTFTPVVPHFKVSTEWKFTQDGGSR